LAAFDCHLARASYETRGHQGASDSRAYGLWIVPAE
jgi:hypothetical protein